MKTKYIFLGIIISSLSICQGVYAQSGKPNVVFILADDLGIGDVSCYGATMIKTPEIDNLASQGMKFENFYTAGATCTPTRYSILTGRYSFRSPDIATDNWKRNLLLDPNDMSIAAVFKQKGYKTAAIGKWHQGYGEKVKLNWDETLKPGPLEIGFDYHWGLPSNHNDQTRGYVENHRLFGLDPNEPYKQADRNKEEPVQGLLFDREDDNVNALLTERAIDFIRTNKDDSFFLYFTPTIAHTHITPNSKFRGTSEAGQYGDFVQELDFYVGKIMDLLHELNLSENTMLIFTSDNGGQLNDHHTAGLGLNLADESNDVRLKAKSAKTDAREMGHKTNLEFRDGKGSPYQGGFRVPLIVRWPGVTTAGITSDRLVCSSDFLATFASMIDVKIPKNSGEDSFSFIDILNNDKVDVPRTKVALFSKKARSFVDGNWKLVDYSYAVKNPKEIFELFNLAEDPGEENDLKTKEPKQLSLMIKNLKKIVDAGKSIH